MEWLPQKGGHFWLEAKAPPLPRTSNPNHPLKHLPQGSLPLPGHGPDAQFHHAEWRKDARVLVEGVEALEEAVVGIRAGVARWKAQQMSKVLHGGAVVGI